MGSSDRKVRSKTSHLSEFDKVSGKLMHEAERALNNRPLKKEWLRIGRVLDEGKTFSLRSHLQPEQKKSVTEFDRRHKDNPISGFEDALSGRGGQDVLHAAKERLNLARFNFREKLARQDERAEAKHADPDEIARRVVDEQERRLEAAKQRQKDDEQERIRKRIEAEKQFFEKYPNGDPLLHQVLAEARFRGGN